MHPYSFHLNGVTEKRSRDHLVLYATASYYDILVFVLFAPPSLLTVSFETLIILYDLICSRVKNCSCVFFVEREPCCR